MTGTAPCDCAVPPLPHKITIDGSLPATNVDVLSHGPPVPDARDLWGSAQPLGGASLGGTERPAESWSTRETSARLVHSARPRYPEMLRTAGVEGRVLVRFAIDTIGRVDAASITIVQSTHDLFSRAVRDVMPSLRLVPAEVNGHRVPMLAEMAFEFALDRR
jgi:protein TonB